MSDLTGGQRFWRNRRFARLRHALALPPFRIVTRMHARLIQWSGGRIRRSYLLAGGMPILVLTTIGGKTGKPRSTPLSYLRVNTGFAVLASNAGSDHTPAWWLNLQATPRAEVLADRVRYTIVARAANPVEDTEVWRRIAELNPGFDEYRNLTTRKIPVVFLDTQV